MYIHISDPIYITPNYYKKQIDAPVFDILKNTILWLGAKKDIWHNIGYICEK